MPDIVAALQLDAYTRFRIVNTITDQSSKRPAAFLIEQLRPSQTGHPDADSAASAPRYWVSARHIQPAEPEPSELDQTAEAADERVRNSDQQKKAPQVQ